MKRTRHLSYLLLRLAIITEIIAISNAGILCPGNKSVLLLGNLESEVISANNSTSSPSCSLPLQHQVSDSGSLEVLVDRLKDGELDDTIAVLHPGDTEDIGVIAQILNILMIPLVTVSFPLAPASSFHHIQMVPSELNLLLAIQAIIDEYGWTRAAILTQDNSVFIEIRDAMISLWETEGISVIHQLVINSSTVSEIQPGDLFADDVRIFILNMNFNLLKEVICQVRHLAHYSSYVWITYGWFEGEWWKNGVSECTAGDLEEYLDGSLTVNHFPFTNSDLREEKSVMKSETDRLAIDALRTVAHALNHKIANGSLTTKSFDSVSFNGKSGPVSFMNGIRAQGMIRVFQYRKDKESNSLRKKIVALVNLPSNDDEIQLNFTYLNGANESTVWSDGVPLDGTPIKVQHYPFLALMVLVYLFAVAGLVFTAACLVFNIVFRDKKLIRLSSPTLNYLIIIGAALLYLSSMGFFYPQGSSLTYISALCTFKVFTSSFGYSFAFGTINVKMWRIYYICTRKKSTVRGVPLKDWHLIMAVMVLVMIHLLFAIITTPIESARASAVIIPNKQNTGFSRNSDGIKEISVVAICASPTRSIWLTLLIGYDIIFQAIGVFLAFKIRKVKITGLNESREVSAILCITSAILVIMIVVTFALSEYIDVEAFVFGAGICVVNTIVLALTFIPKMWGLYKDPKGKNVLKGMIASSKRDTDVSYTGDSNEVVALQARIRELEQIVKQGAE